MSSLTQAVDSEGLFRISFKYRFEAAHRFTHSTSGPCMTPHGHTWHAEATFASPSPRLDNHDMVLEFSLLKKRWKAFIQETVDHSFLHHHDDAILPALRENIPRFRGLPFPGDPTTEMIATLFLAKLISLHRALRRELETSAEQARLFWPQPMSVRIAETPTNSIRIQNSAAFATLLQQINAAYEGWWMNDDPFSRAFNRR